MKVLFLDFDGVIIPISPTGVADDYPTPSMEAVENLNILVQLSGAEVVVSSSWRIDRSVEELRALLASWGLKYPEKVIDKIPYSPDEDEAEDRHTDIREWLSGKDVSGFVVVDDDPTAMEELSKQLVTPKPDLGLQWHDVVEALRIFFGEGSLAGPARQLESGRTV